MYLTKQQVKQLLDKKPLNLNDNQVIEGLVSRGYTLEGLNGEAPTQEVSTDNSPGFIDSLKKDWKQRELNVKETKTRQAQGQGSTPETIIKSLGQGAGFVGDIVTETVKAGARTISDITPDVIEKPVTDTAKQAGLSLLDSEVGKAGIEALKGGMETYSSWKTQNPRIADALESIINIASVIPATKAAKIGAEGVEQGVKAGARAGVKTLQTAGKDAKSISSNSLKFFTSQTTGLSPSTIETIFKNPDEFLAESAAKYTREGLGKQVKNAIDNKIAEVGEAGKVYETIKNSSKPVKTNSDWLKTWLVDNKYSNSGLEIKPTKLAKFSGAEKKAYKDFVDIWGGKNSLTAEEFLDGRQFLSQWGDFGNASTTEGTNFFRNLRYNYNQNFVEKFPGLRQIDQEYGPKIEELRLLKKDYLNADGTLKDNALSKIANLDKKGREIVLSRLENVEPGIGQKIKIMSALEDISNATGQKVGTYARAGLGVAGAASFSPPLILAAILLEPTVATKVLRAVGKTYGLAKTKIDNILNKYDIKNFGKEVIDEIKNTPAGLSIKNTNIDESLLNEAKKYKSAEEFVKAKGDSLYHTTGADFELFDNKFRGSNTDAPNTNSGFFFSDNLKNIDDFKNTLQKGFQPSFTSDLVKKDASKYRTIEKVADKSKFFDLNLSKGVNEKQAEFLTDFFGTETGEKLKGQAAIDYVNENYLTDWEFDAYLQESMPKIAKLLKKKGYIGVKSDFGGGVDEYLVFDPNKLPTKSQLEEIWNMANKKQPSKAAKVTAKAIVGSAGGAASYGSMKEKK